MEMRVMDSLRNMSTTYAAFAAIEAKDGHKIYNKLLTDLLNTLE